MLNIDPGLRRPGASVAKYWWDQEHERARCRVAVAMADPVVPDTVKNVKTVPITRHIQYLKQYLHAHAAALFHPKLDFILIEQQPSRGTRSIYTISYVMYAIIGDIYLHYNPHRKDDPPKVDFASSGLKTKHMPKERTQTRPMRKRAVFEDMMVYLRKQSPKELALAQRLQRHTAKFDICDTIAQGLAWFTIHVKRSKRRPFLGEAAVKEKEETKEEEVVVVCVSSDEGPEEEEEVDYRKNTWSETEEEEDDDDDWDAQSNDEAEEKRKHKKRRLQDNTTNSRMQALFATCIPSSASAPAPAPLPPVPFSQMRMPPSVRVEVEEYIA